MESSEILLIVIVFAVLLRVLFFGKFSEQKDKGCGG